MIQCHHATRSLADVSFSHASLAACVCCRRQTVRDPGNLVGRSDFCHFVVAVLHPSSSNDDREQKQSRKSGRGSRMQCVPDTQNSTDGAISCAETVRTVSSIEEKRSKDATHGTVEGCYATGNSQHPVPGIYRTPRKCYNIEQEASP